MFLFKLNYHDQKIRQTLDLQNHWTTVSTLLDLISSVYRDPVTPFVALKSLPDFLVMVIQFTIWFIFFVLFCFVSFFFHNIVLWSTFFVSIFKAVWYKVKNSELRGKGSLTHMLLFPSVYLSVCLGCISGVNICLFHRKMEKVRFKEIPISPNLGFHKFLLTSIIK